MNVYLTSISLLILAVVIIRAAFRKKISPRIIYALWLVVVIRMIIPFSLFQIELPDHLLSKPGEQAVQTVNVENDVISYDLADDMNETDYQPASSDTVLHGEISHENDFEENAITATGNNSEKTHKEISWKAVFFLIWITGAVLLAAWFTGSSIVFLRELHQDRKLYKTVGKTKVFLSSGTGAPCLSDFIPSVYLKPEDAQRGNVEYIIKHELTHLMHGDNIWSVIRVIAVCVFWFNPLVWVAAVLSKRDAELAVDDSVADFLNESERIVYARAILDSASRERKYVPGFGSAPIKERIAKLVEERKRSTLLSIIAVLLIIPCVLSSFIFFASAETTLLSGDNPLSVFGINENDYYYDASLWAYDNNIVKETSGSEFSPDSPCTRAELITYLWRFMGEPEPVLKRNPFVDIEESDYYYKAVLWAYKTGITRGTGNRHFSPEKSCSYSEVLTMIWRAEGAHWSIGKGDWSTDAFNWAEMMNITLNIDNNRQYPSGLCPQKDVITLIYRSLKMNSVEEWMGKYKGCTLEELYDNDEILYCTGKCNLGYRYCMTNSFGLYLLADGTANDSKVIGAQFIGSNWITENGISPLMKGVHANQNFNNWEKTEASEYADGKFYTYCTDEAGNSMKAVWEISGDVYDNWYRNNAFLSNGERLVSYNELVSSNKNAAIGYVYYYYMTYPTD